MAEGIYLLIGSCLIVASWLIRRHSYYACRGDFGLTFQNYISHLLLNPSTLSAQQR